MTFTCWARRPPACRGPRPLAIGPSSFRRGACGVRGRDPNMDGRLTGEDVLRRSSTRPRLSTARLPRPDVHERRQSLTLGTLQGLLPPTPPPSHPPQNPLSPQPGLTRVLSYPRPHLSGPNPRSNPDDTNPAGRRGVDWGQGDNPLDTGLLRASRGLCRRRSPPEPLNPPPFFRCQRGPQDDTLDAAGPS